MCFKAGVAEEGAWGGLSSGAHERGGRKRQSGEMKEKTDAALSLELEPYGSLRLRVPEDSYDSVIVIAII